MSTKTTITSVKDLKYQSISESCLFLPCEKATRKQDHSSNQTTAPKRLVLLRQVKNCLQQQHYPSDAQLHSLGFVRVKYASVTQHQIEMFTK